MGDGLAVPQSPDDGEELVGAGVTVVLAEVIAVRALFVRFTAGDNVEQDPAGCMQRERGRHLRGERPTDQARAERDEERDPSDSRATIAAVGKGSSHHAPVVAVAQSRPVSGPAGGGFDCALSRVNCGRRRRSIYRDRSVSI